MSPTPVPPVRDRLRALAPDLDPVRPGLALAVALAVASDLAGLAALLALCRTIASLGDPGSGDAGADGSGTVMTWALITVTSWILAAVLGPLSDLVSHQAEARFEGSLRRRLARHILALPWSVRSRYPAETLRRRVTDDVRDLHHLVAHAPADIATFLVFPAVGAILLVLLCGPAPLTALVPGAVAAVFHLVVLPRVAAALDDRRMQAVSGVVSAAEDYARGARIQRLYGTGAGAARRYREQVADFSRAMVAWVNRSAPPAALAAGLLQAATTLALGYAAAHDRPAGELATVLLLSLAVTAPALKLGHGVDHIRTGLAAAARLTELLGEARLPASLPGDPGTRSRRRTPPVNLRTEDLHADAVSVLLDGREVLHDLTASFPAGSLTAVTGPSGAGKTTLLHTLAGLEAPTTGTVTLGDLSVTAVDGDTRPHMVLYVPQDADVVDGTVRDNLRLVFPDDAAEVPDSDLLRALESACAGTLDLDRRAGELSGGERQRLTVARAFLTDAPVVLLDEPTSALDTDTARRLVTSLRALPRTVVMVTHDPSLLIPADNRLELP